MTLIFYLKHTLTFVIILQPSDVNFNHFQLHAQKLTLKFLAKKTVLTSVKADLDLLA